MNKYKVTAMVDGTNKKVTFTVYCEGSSNDAISEAFYKTYGTQGFSFHGAERIETATASRAEERAALTQIQAIVASLGEDSYIGTAFKGCFDIARENIDNDFACSLHDRWHETEKKLVESVRELSAAKADFRASVQQYEDKLKKLQEKIEWMEGDEADLRDALIAAEGRQLSQEMRRTLDAILTDASHEAEEAMKLEAGKMAEYIALGKTEESKKAAKAYLARKETATRITQVIDELNEMNEEE